VKKAKVAAFRAHISFREVLLDQNLLMVHMEGTSLGKVADELVIIISSKVLFFC